MSGVRAAAEFGHPAAVLRDAFGAEFHTMDIASIRSRSRPVVLGLGLFILAELVAAIAATSLAGWSWQTAYEGFVVTNSAMALSFGVCGALIAYHRPRNWVGWLFLADGIGHATTALAAPVTTLLQQNGAPMGWQRLAAALFGYSWPWSISLFLPLALILFPDGRLPSSRWRPWVWAFALTAPVFVVSMGAEPGVSPAGVEGYLTLASYDRLSDLWLFAELRTVAFMALGMLGIFLRYRRSEEVVRRQLLWVLLGTGTVVVVVILWSLVAGTPIAVLLAIPLIPISVAVGILRYQLLDIKLVVSRALAFVLLSAATVAVYLAMVAVLERMISDRFGGSAVATALLIVLISPLLPRVQRWVDRAMYGDRTNLTAVASRVGEELLAHPGGELEGVAGAVRSALRLPYVAVTAGAVLLSSAGSPTERLENLQLNYAGRTVGELIVGLRPGEQELDPADLNALTLVIAPLAVAIHATQLTQQLQLSREQIVAAREEERRRLQRDLHDGLGPTLTGMALAADAAANLVLQDAGRTRELVDGIRRDSRQAIADVRRLVDNLRPPALDELGLLGALRQRADQAVRRADGEPIRVTVLAAEPLPALPAAIEVAAFRIATEALTNVVRHSKAAQVVMELSCGERFEITVGDDGPMVNGTWREGVGLQAIRERVAELNGTFQAGPTPAGARVHVSFPLDRK